MILVNNNNVIVLSDSGAWEKPEDHEARGDVHEAEGRHLEVGGRKDHP
jgi:hypothetical protein